MKAADMDIRWKQRLSQFKLALKQMDSAVSLSKVKELSDLEKQGLIKSFEYTHELAWNLMKDFFEYQGNFKIMGSRDATREAFAKGLIVDGNVWIKMIESRNLTSHTYNQGTANQVIKTITQDYFPLFVRFENKMNLLSSESET